LPTHEELARFLRRFNRLPPTIRLAFIAAALQLAEDLGDRGSTRRSSGRSFAGQYRAVFHLGEQRRPGHAHIVWEFIGSHDEYKREY
jgi:hypothetical protein